jgi:Glycosyltransferase
MRVLLVHKFFNYNGGADVFFFEVGRVLKENGHEVAYFSTNNERNKTSEWARYFVDAPNFKSSSPVKKLKAITEIPYNLRIKKAFIKLIDSFKPDLVHCFNIMTQISPSIIVAAHERNIPVVISLNDYKHICPNYKLYHHGHLCEDCKGGKFYKCFTNKCAHNSMTFSLASSLESYVHLRMGIYEKYITMFTFSSDFMADKTEDFWGRKLIRVKMMNPFKFSARVTDTSREYGLYFGRLIDEKGVDILVRALAECSPNVKFKIIGNGPDEEMLQELAKKLNIENLEFCGPKWGIELDEYLKRAKYVVVPSTWHENFPYVILQAFNFCKAVIGSDRGGIPEMLANGRGLLYEANDPKQLTEKIMYMESHNEEAIAMGENGRKYVEDKFTDEVFYTALLRGYEKALTAEKLM